MKMLYWGYSKQILNAKADGLSTKPAGGDEVLEIVPMSEVAEFSVGKTVKFKALFKGNPLPNAKVEWADQQSPSVIGDEGPTNTKEIAKTAADRTFEFTIKHAGYNCFGIMHGIPVSGADRNFDYYATILIVDVPGASASSEKSGGSGCNSGFGIMLLAAVAASGLIGRNSLKTLTPKSSHGISDKIIITKVSPKIAMIASVYRRYDALYCIFVL